MVVADPWISVAPKVKHLFAELGREQSSVQSAKFVVVEGSIPP